VSGQHLILSAFLELLAEFGFCPMQTDRDGIGSDTEHNCDLGGLELFPGPQLKELAVGVVEGPQGVVQLRVEWVFGPFEVDRFEFHSADQAEATKSGAAVVGNLASGHPIDPRQHCGVGDIVNPSPDGEHRLGNDVVDRVRIDPAAHITLDRFVPLGEHRLEVPPARVTSGSVSGHGDRTSFEAKRFPMPRSGTTAFSSHGAFRRRR
jgi:hypothetical protein